MPQHLAQVGPPARRTNESLEGRHFDVIVRNQVPEEGRLGEDLDIQKR
jgi:hypothetical protein